MIEGNKGQLVFYTFMVSVIVLVLALAFMGPVQTFTTTAMANDTGSGGLNCTTAGMDIYYQSTCIVTDLTLPLFIGALLTFAGIIIGARVMFA